MPGLGFSEILIILVFALIVFGPKRLPEIGRAIGRSMREFRKASAEIRAELDLGLDEEPPRVPSPGDRARETTSPPRGTAPGGEPSAPVRPKAGEQGGEHPIE